MLDGLSLTVQRGEIFGFLGGNGAGKTTTLKILMRLMAPTAGRARMLGHDAGDVAVHARVGYLPEAPYFYDYLTARELLAVLRGAVRLPAARAAGARGRSARRASASTNGLATASCGSSPRACCSASGWPRRSSTIPSWWSSTSR